MSFPRLPEFFARFPDIVIETVVTDRTLNLVEQGIDLAIYNGDLGDSTLVARKIAMTPIVTVTTPSYLERYGEPAIPGDLDKHRCVIYSPSGAPRAWRFRDEEIQPKGQFRSNDAEEIRAAVLSDIGLAHAPEWLFAREIASNTVRRVLCDYAPTPLSISAVHPAGRRLATKVRVLIDFLAEIFAAEPTLALRPA